jgi:hypothetical protein
MSFRIKNVLAKERVMPAVTRLAGPIFSGTGGAIGTRKVQWPRAIRPPRSRVALAPRRA